MSQPRQAIHRYAKTTAIVTFLLLIAGGLVTSTDSGLAVPDWPLSYGAWFPPMVGGIVYEHGHRMIAGLVGLMILVLAGWLWKIEPRRWVRLLGYSALAAVILQALLGGLTVLLLLPPLVSVAHACLGQTVFCLVVALTQCTAHSWLEHPACIEDRGWPTLRTLGAGVVLCAALQLILGAVVCHTGLAVSAHVIGAIALLLITGWLVARIVLMGSSVVVIRSHAVRLLGLLCVQGALGVAVFTHRGAIVLRTAHVATGALLLAQAVILVWELCRHTAPAIAVPAAQAVSARVT